MPPETLARIRTLRARRLSRSRAHRVITPVCTPKLFVIFTETPLRGAFVVDPEPVDDERGFFARTWCRREFKERGLETRVAQCSLSFNRKRGTLRGLHFQVAPYAETKIIRCVRGAVYDVIVDLRPDSRTFTQHFALTLTSKNHAMLYVPAGFAHGFQTLDDDTEVLYQISAFYSPEHSRGVRWDDPAFAIQWPPAERTISARDRDYPDFSSALAVAP
jgi:dTDP-4-dehydrorhamnose 3,5-epimerase